MNLFSMFDPSTSIFSWAWVVIVFPIIVLLPSIKKSSTSYNTAKSSIVINIKKECSYSIKTPQKGILKTLIRIFLLIFILNFVALYPQVFSTTAHVVISTPLALILWASLIIFGWLKNTKHILAHLLPQGTPTMLINFMVLIELIRNTIRPLTLCVRLTANITAGHLLMLLLGNLVLSQPLLIWPLSFILPVVLTILESAVALIQAYVFITLITLYSTETHYDNKVSPLPHRRKESLTPGRLSRGPSINNIHITMSKQEG